MGHDSRAFLPRYGFIDEPSVGWEAEPLTVHLANEARATRTLSAAHGQGKVVFLEENSLYGGDAVYWHNKDNTGRYAFLCRAAVDYCHAHDWWPDVVHCHDWHSGLFPVFLNSTEVHTPLHRAASLFTIHNLFHQGETSPQVATWATIPPAVTGSEELRMGQRINLMKAGLFHATKLSTVSSNYAQEIQTPAFGCGLDPVLRNRAGDLCGILNGIDTSEWNPATDKLIPARFSADDLSGKAICKSRLQQELGLEQSDRPLFVAVARLVEQKGLDLLVQIMDGLMQDMAVQVAVLGSGDPALENALRSFADRYRGNVSCFIGYDHRMSHLFEAGADFFLMPSRFEPCGLNQMYSMAYGTIPIVRETGGLVDSVDQYDERLDKGTGFRFRECSGHALYHTIGWACQVYYDAPEELSKIRERAMRKELGWERSALLYQDLYLWAVDTRLRGCGYADPRQPLFRMPSVPAAMRH